MQKLAGAEAGALAKGDRKTAVNCKEQEKKFLKGYMLKWPGEFAKTVKRQTKSVFYGEIAGLTKRFMEFEEKEIEQSSF